jgi:hypothetical protein
MRIAIQLYDQFGSAAEKVRKIGANWHLAAKFEALDRGVSQLSPELAFSRRC